MKKIFLVVLFILNALVAFSQSASNVNVDNMTDAQIKQILKQAEANGLTTSAQIEKLALAKGVSQAELVKFNARVERIKAQGNTTSSDDNNNDYRRTLETDTNSVDKKKNKKDRKEVDLDDEDKEPRKLKKDRIFGQDLFKKGAITFEPNLRMATPKNYVVGPDDKLIIDITGDNEKSYNLTVSPDGVINLEYVGRIAVAGLTIEQATSKIKAAMTKTYAAIKSGRTSVAVNLGNIRSIQVTVTGQAQNAGTYTIPSLANAYRLLYLAGGPSENGSLRNIQIIRNNKVIAQIDAYEFLLQGLQKGNVRLQDQDVVNIPAYTTRVQISGEVKEEAIYEMKEGEKLKDLLAFAKGFTAEAYTANIKVLQNTNRERRVDDVSAERFSTYSPSNGDKYIVEPIIERFENRVEIIGSVFRPGVYALSKDLTLGELIKKADGVTEDAFMSRGYISRLNADKTQNFIAFDVAKVLSGEEKDILLTREDKINISSIFDLREEYTLTIQGEVRAPGTFPFGDNVALEDIIQMAGGLKEGASPNRVEISRRVKTADPTSKQSRIAEVFVVKIDEKLRLVDEKFELKPFDIISIRSSESYTVQKQVKIEGEVLYPGMYTITNKNYRISDLIASAGGLTTFAYAEGGSLKRPGAAKVNPLDKNAIDNTEDESKKYLTLERVQEKTKQDPEIKKVDEKLVESDLVGINLKVILKKPQGRQDIILEEGDIVRVPKQLQTIKVIGEVLNPNSIVFVPGKSFKQYISGAGGFTANAKKSGAYIRYANGAAESSKKFLFFNNHPKVKPGAEILVPVRAERERLNAQAWVGIGTALASISAVIISVLR